MIYLKILVFAVCVACTQWSTAQIICKDFYVSGNQTHILVDSLPVYQNSILFFPQNIAGIKMGLNENALTFFSIAKGDILVSDSLHVKVCFERIPVLYNPTVQLFDTVLIHAEYVYNTNVEIQSVNSAVSDDKFQVKGAISRGMGLGNRKDVSVTSGTNLKASGLVYDSTTFSLILSQKDLPTQNFSGTYQANDFNFFRVNLKNPYFNLQAGEISLDDTTVACLKNTIQTTGAHLYTSALGKHKMRTGVYGGIMAGFYETYQIRIIGGNQGPYSFRNHLPTGVFIMPASVKVYANGMLLNEGADKDFTVDYLNGNILFTPYYHVLGSELIEVHFRYALNEKQRYTTGANMGAQMFGSDLNISYYRHTETLNGLDENDLSPQLSQLYQMTGDEPIVGTTFFSKVKTVGNSDIVYYLLADTLVAGVFYRNIVVEAPLDADSAYFISFQYAGENKGNYIKVNSVRNQSVYKWVAPNGKTPAGNYDVVASVSLLQVQQLLRFSWNMNSGRQSTNLWMAASDKDDNKFSGLDDEDNAGMAMGFKTGQRITENERFAVHLLLSGEFLHQQFNALNKVHDASFIKLWNLPFDYRTKHFGHESIGLHIKSTNGRELLLASEFLQLKNEYDAFAEKFYYTRNNTNFSTGIENVYMYSNHLGRKSNSVFTKAFTEKKWNKHILKASGVFEWRESDFYVQSPQNYRLHNYSLNYESADTLITRIKTSLGFHSFQNTDSLETEPASGFLSNHLFIPFKKNGSIDVYMHLKKYLSEGGATVSTVSKYRQQLFGFMQVNQMVENYTGNEPLLIIRYVAVPKGQGTHIWLDKNNNKLQELNEFETAFYTDEATHIKLHTASSHEFRPSKGMKLNGNLSFYFNKFKWDDFQISTNHMYLFNRKVMHEQNLLKSMFFHPLSDTMAISNQFYAEQNIKIQIRNFGVVLNLQNTLNAQQLPLGSNEYVSSVKRVQTSLLLHSNHVVLAEYENGSLMNKYSTVSRFYNILHHLWQLQYKHALLQNAELNLLVKYSIRREQETQLQSNMPSVVFVTKYDKPSLFSTEILLQYSHIFLNKNADMYYQYEVLEGLKAGANFIGNVILNGYLSDKWQVNTSLQVRISESSKTVYTGNLGVKAIL